MSDKIKLPRKPKKVIGRVEPVTFVDNDNLAILARVDTGARTSSVWATGIVERDGVLHFALLGPAHEQYSGQIHQTKHFWKTAVASSIGIVQQRYVVRLRVKLRGRKIIARFTLADRSTQVYPVLVGRNVLRGKFIVDVNMGKPDIEAEEERTRELQSQLKT